VCASGEVEQEKENAKKESQMPTNRLILQYALVNLDDTFHFIESLLEYWSFVIIFCIAFHQEHYQTTPPTTRCLACLPNNEESHKSHLSIQKVKKYMST